MDNHVHPDLRSLAIHLYGFPSGMVFYPFPFQKRFGLRIVFALKGFVKSGIIRKAGFGAGGSQTFLFLRKRTRALNALGGDVLVNCTADIFFEQTAHMVFRQKCVLCKLV